MENKMIDQMCSEENRKKGKISEFKKKKKTPLIETSVQFTSKVHHKKIRKLISV